MAKKFATQIFHFSSSSSSLFVSCSVLLVSFVLFGCRTAFHEKRQTRKTEKDKTLHLQKAAPRNRSTFLVFLFSAFLRPKKKNSLHHETGKRPLPRTKPPGADRPATTNKAGAAAHSKLRSPKGRYCCLVVFCYSLLWVRKQAARKNSKENLFVSSAVPN